MAQKKQTIASILRELSERYDDIVAEREICDLVLARQPSRAKDPYAGIREKLRYGAARVGWVRLDSRHLIPLKIALQDLSFRIIPGTEERTSGMIAYSHLEPFVTADAHELVWKEASGQTLPTRKTMLPLDEGLFGTISTAAIDLGRWFEHTGFEEGDSIIIRIQSVRPLTLMIQREPSAAFRADIVSAQEQAFLDELVEQVQQTRSEIVLPEDSVLPVYARANWRTSYPGRPWQHLVATDARLRLIDDMYITAISPDETPLDFDIHETDAQFQADFDHDLLKEIIAFQAELRQSRRADVDEGLWDGIAPRISTSYIVFDHQHTPATVYAGPVDTLQDYASEIDERAARGDFDEAWSAAFAPDKFEDIDFDDDPDADDDIFDIEDIEDMRAFLDQNAALVEATQKLIASLSPDEFARLQNAETPDEIQHVLTKRLNELLRREPALFAPLEVTPPDQTNGNGNGHANGNGHYQSEPMALTDLPLIDATAWNDDEDDALWADQEGGNSHDAHIERILERSSDLMEQFYQKLIADGKSESTAVHRAGDLWAYAEFLGNYYERSLDEGDYATLDECLFFFYPRKMQNNSPRQAREMCISIKQFYHFLFKESIVASDVFAQAMWRRRAQAARLIELYDLLDSDSPRFEVLFAHLFAPYTV